MLQTYILYLVICFNIYIGAQCRILFEETQCETFHFIDFCMFQLICENRRPNCLHRNIVYIVQTKIMLSEYICLFLQNYELYKVYSTYLIIKSYNLKSNNETISYDDNIL